MQLHVPSTAAALSNETLTGGVKAYQLQVFASRSLARNLLCGNELLAWNIDIFLVHFISEQNYSVLRAERANGLEWLAIQNLSSGVTGVDQCQGLDFESLPPIRAIKAE